MSYIIGLGNPGDKYKKTRHNIGDLVINLCEDKALKPISKYKIAKAMVASVF